MLAPQPGYLFTPGYWAFSDGVYVWHPGHWGLTIGYYEGVNYGFGYTGNGFYGGHWESGHFFYNRFYNNVDERRVHRFYREEAREGTGMSSPIAIMHATIGIAGRNIGRLSATAMVTNAPAAIPNGIPPTPSELSTQVAETDQDIMERNRVGEDGRFSWLPPQNLTRCRKMSARDDAPIATAGGHSPSKGRSSCGGDPRRSRDDQGLPGRHSR